MPRWPCAKADKVTTPPWLLPCNLLPILKQCCIQLLDCETKGLTKCLVGPAAAAAAAHYSLPPGKRHWLGSSCLLQGCAHTVCNVDDRKQWHSKLAFIRLQLRAVHIRSSGKVQISRKLLLIHREAVPTQQALCEKQLAFHTCNGAANNPLQTKCRCYREPLPCQYKVPHT